jgi:5-methylcytosine-specific restriction endonuclease McrA
MEAHVRLEKERARALRQSRWWQNQLHGAVCYYCRRALARAEVTMDHIVPLAQGGRSNPGNVVTACKLCNSKKRDMTAVEFTLWTSNALSPSGD